MKEDELLILTIILLNFPKMINVFKPPFLKHLYMTFTLLFIFFGAIAGNEPIPKGSYIINMGVLPQTIGNGLKPYGLVYELINKYSVPVKWSINTTKVKDGIDFSFGGVDYKGGTFIIPAEFLTPAVQTAINGWLAQGVVATKTTADIASVPIYTTLIFVPKITLDVTNGSISQAYLVNAGFPSTSYYFKSAQTLTCCDDIYVMPHADPAWTTHSNLYGWNLTCKGAIWAACHAVSVLENMNNGTLQTNFLMNNKTSVGTAAVPFGTHVNGSIPYALGESSDPVMQFMGKTDLAQLNGSEQVYLPQLSWRGSTKIGVWDDTHANVPGLSPGKAALIAYGSGFGDPARGKVMYEAGHSHNKGTVDDVAAQRAFLNFILWASQDKAMKVAVTGVPSFIPGGSTVSSMKVSVDAPVPASPFKYEWISSCGGSFSNATGTFNNPADGITATLTNFTAPAAPTTSFPCVLSCKITDACGRVSFITQAPTIQSPPAPPVAVNDYKTTKPETLVSVLPLGNDSDPNNDPLTLTLTGMQTTANGRFGLAADGKTVMYKPNPGFIGKDSIQYKICDPGPLCSTAYIVINVIETSGPCGVGGELAVIGTGYGATVIAQTGNVSNPLNVLGSFNNSGTKLARNTNSTITIDLGYSVYKDDKIVLKLASGNSRGTTFVVTSGVTSGTFTSPVSFKNIVKINSFGTYNYVVFQDSVRYIKISVASTNPYDSYIDGISYPIRGCITKCSPSEKTIKSTKYAASVFSQNGVNSPTNAVGLPNNSGAELTKASSDQLTLDLGEIVPQGTQILVYLASKSATTTTTGVTFPVSSSLDGVTFSGIINHPITSYAPQFTACKYVVSQASGIRYLKIAAGSGTQDGIVDGIVFTSIKCIPISPVAKNDTVKICEDNVYAFDPRTNDYDPQDLPLSVKITLTPTNGLATVNVNGKVNYSPNRDFSGFDQIKYQVCNTLGFCSEATIFITVPDDGCAVDTYKPTIFTPQTATITTGEDTWLDQSNPDRNNGIATTLSVNTGVGQIKRSLIKFNIGSALIPADAVITSATLRLYKTGSKTETVKIYRETTAWTEGTFNNATGDPSWNEVSSGNKWSSGTGGDYDSTHLVVSKVIPITNGVYVDFDVSSLAKQWIDGGLPNQGFLLRAATEGGSDNVILFNSTEASTNKPELVINYQLIDCTTSACTIIPNKSPLAYVDDTCATYNTPILIDVLANDKDPDNNISPTTLTILNGLNGFPKSGTVSISNGKLLYTPNNLSVKTDTVYYKICDLGSPSLCDTSYAIICINNVPIIASDDAGITPSGTPIIIGVKSNDMNPLGGPTTLSDVPQCPPANGTIVIQGDSIIYTPNTGFTGVDKFKYIICNNNFVPVCDTVEVTITVSNNAPITENDTVTTTACKSILIDVLANDSDPEGNNLEVISVQNLSPSTAGTISYSSTGVTFSPSATATGQIKFTYTVQDDGITPKQTTDTIVVNIGGTPPVNNAPIAVNDTTDTISGQPLYWNVRDNDSDPDGEQLNIKLPNTIKKPSNGTVSLTPNGLIQYLPNAGFAGKDTLEYQICDTLAVSPGCTPRVNLCSIAKLFITVFPLPIEAVPDLATAIVGVPKKIFILTNDKNPDGTTANLSKVTTPVITTQPTKGTVVVNPDGTIDYTPNAGASGSDTLIYTICDVLNPTICDTALVTVKIANPPIANSDGIIPVISATTISILANDKNPDGTLVTDLSKISTPVVTTAPTKGTVVVNPDGTVTYTPNAGTSGTDTFIYTICDKVNTTLCDTALVTVKIANPPIANPDGIIPIVSAATISILANDKNLDGTLVTDLSKITTPVITTAPTKGTVVVNPDGTVTYTPNAGTSGMDTFIYTICDKVNTTLCGTAEVTVNITKANIESCPCNQ